MKFGDFLKQKREERGWTQPEAAAKAGIEQSYLSKLETGKSYPSEEVFTRLVDAYGINVTQLAETVASRELSKLQEIGEIRTFLLERETKIKRASRGWLLGGLIMMMIGAGNFGLQQIGEDTIVRTNYYKSDGVLKPGEPLDMFDIVYSHLSGSPNNVAEFEARKSEITKRLDPIQIASTENRGADYIENVDGGRRHYRHIDTQTYRHRSPLRWFIIPALAFLVGSFGCFFISFRWR